MLASRKRIAGALGLGLIASGLLISPASANPAGTGLVIKEVYGGGGNSGATLKNDFVELYNPTGSPISLAGWSLQYRSGNGTAAATNIHALSGSVPANGHFLVQEAAGNGGTDDLPSPDATGTLALSGTGGQIWLASTTTGLDPADGNVITAPPTAGLVDFVGWGPATTSREGAAPAPATTNTTSVSRTATGLDTDGNATDFGAGAPTPTGSGPVAPVALAVTDPGDRSGFVGTAIAPISLAAVGGTAPYTWSASGLPAGITLTGNQISGTPTTAGTSEVTLTATDSATPTAATDTETFTFTVSVVPTQRSIAEIQGTGPRSPFAPAEGTGAGDAVLTRGVVTASYPTGGFQGMYIQAPGPDTDGASDAIFVYGANATPSGVQIGDSVEVVGTVSEFAGTTEITPAAGGVAELDTSLGAIAARDIAYPTTETTREAREGELIAPTDDFTVTNSFGTNQYAEIGLATGDHPLVQPTEVKKSTDAAGIAAVKADNAARAVVLDDASSINYLTTGKDTPLPWMTASKAVRVGASVTLEQPVILEYRNNVWKFQPTEQVTDDGSDVATIEDTRDDNLAPQPVGGDLKLATFNVLNYFNTTGQKYVANGAAQSPPVNTACTYYNDRAGTPIGNNTCGVVTNGTNAGNGPRGAATDVSLARQQAKAVLAINTLGADIVGLEEIENSMKLTGETNRDDAVATLVAALNDAAGAGTWKYVHSPAEALVAAAVSEQDVIRPAFIYKPAKVTPVGQSDILFGTTAFANAREPLAQAFKPAGALDSAAFAVVVNHFKSKGDSTPPQSGEGNDNVTGDQGAFNGDRKRQAAALATFADEFAEARGIEAVFLAGDLNSYSQEDPMQVLYDQGYEAIESDQADDETYSFSGLSGSMDHILGNEAAMAMVTGADVWDINASESPAYQYSRYNYNATLFFDATNPFAASDHNPEVVGLDLPDYSTDHSEVQIIGTNDFHGRLLADGANAAGAAVLAGAVDELRADNADTGFVAAGDLIGASTFESFIQNDEPTIEALNEAGLDVSAAGNHEFDQGYEDLVGRVQDAADWEYIAANVVEPAGRDDLAESWTQTFDTDAGAIKVGYVGAVTEDLPSLVSPAGIQGVTVTDIVDATNTEAAALKADGADLVVLLVHEGSPTTNCASMTDSATTWGNIVTGVDDDVDAIVSGHTHLAYNCSFPVAGWSDREVTDRPVVSAGQYGTFLNRLVFSFDDTTGELVAKSQDVIGLVGTGYAPNAEVAATVAAAKAAADVLGAKPLGQIDGAFNRAQLSTGVENRGGESTLGNLVAEVQRWATRNPESGSAQIAFMNPGGLRADMVGSGTEAFPRTLTYKQAAVVQPFANTLVNMRLTGTQIKTVLEQQWQRDAGGAVPSRPFLRLGVSKGFTYTYDPALAEGSRITGMWLDGEPIVPATSYSVTVNSFLASGGDNFRELANGTGKKDTGKVDLQAMVDYLKEFASTTPLPVDYTQRAVGVSFPADAPETYQAGDHVTFALSSLALSTAADLKDSQVEVSLGDDELGTFDVDNTIGAAVFDEYGTAAVDVVLPAGVDAGDVTLTVTGLQTGTEVLVPITVDAAELEASSLTVGNVKMTYGKSATVKVSVTPKTATGTVRITQGSKLLGSAPVTNGVATVTLKAKSLEPGKVGLTASYSGDASVKPATKAFTVTVAKASSKTNATVTPGKVVVKKTRATVTIRVVGSNGVTATGTVKVRVTGQGTVRVTLRNGKATLRLGKFSGTGKKVVTVDYLGSSRVAGSADRVTFRVTKK